MRPYLGPPWTNSCQIWCVRVFIMCYWNIVMKMLKCKKRKFDDVTLQYSILVEDVNLHICPTVWIDLLFAVFHKQPHRCQYMSSARWQAIWAKITDYVQRLIFDHLYITAIFLIMIFFFFWLVISQLTIVIVCYSIKIFWDNVVFQS